MPGWTGLFLIVALISGLSGFTSVVGPASGSAKIVFLVVLVMIVIALTASALRGSRRRL
jgi:uncharacterized membrane protein YtjA (UPF0391 family)